MPLGVRLPENLKKLTNNAGGHFPRHMHRPRPVNCLNCGQMLTGHYCSNCGQEAVDHRTAIWPIVQEAVEEFARWDSKLVQTIFLLIIRPGFLTNEYNAGKRVKYLSPGRMFLTVSVIFFLLFSANSNNHLISYHSSASTRESGIKVDKKPNKMSVSVNGASIVTDDGDEIRPDVLVSKMKSAARNQTDAEIALAGSKDWQRIPMMFHIKNNNTRLNYQRIYINELPYTLAEFEALQDNLNYPHHYKPYVRRIIENLYNIVVEPELIEKTLLEIIPKAAFCLIPLFAFIVYPLYRRTGHYYVEHLTLVLHNHTFLFLLGIGFIYAPDWLKAVLWIVAFTYVYVSMLVVYKQHWFKTLMKYFFFQWAYFTLLLVVTVFTLFAALYLA